MGGVAGLRPYTIVFITNKTLACCISTTTANHQTLAGLAVYNAWLKSARLRPMLFWGALLGCAVGLTPLLLVEGVNRKLGVSDRCVWVGVGVSASGCVCFPEVRVCVVVTHRLLHCFQFTPLLTPLLTLLQAVCHG